jgi:hypothetical protein
MAETIRGTKAVVWALSTSATATGMGTFTAQSAGFSTDSDKVELRDNRGEVITEIYYNAKEMLTMEVVPTGTTIALAKAANILPAPGAIVTVTDADDTEVAGGSGAEYLFVSGSKAKSNTDMVKLTFNMIRYVANNVAQTPAAS